MFLMKLRAFVAVAVVAFVGAGVVGLAYRTTAAEPGKAGTVTQSATGTLAAADDLEALRLEVEALRKSLDATRKRVTSLEGEVQALKGKGGTGPQPMALDFGFPVQRGADRAPQEGQVFEGGFRSIQGFVMPADLLAEAEAALQKLRANPDDKQAADALEKALQRLKERRAKPQGQTGIPEKNP